jgi:hypothetical protein
MQLDGHRRYPGAVSVYGDDPVDLDKVHSDPNEAKDYDSLVQTTRWLLKSFEHAEHIIRNKHKFIALAEANDDSVSVTFKHAGIVSVWDSMRGTDSRLLNIRASAVGKLLEPYAALLSSDHPTAIRYKDWGSSVWVFNNPKLQQSYVGDAHTPTLQRALWLSKRNNLLNMLGSGQRYETKRDLMVDDTPRIALLVQPDHQSSITVSDFRKLATAMDRHANHKPSIYDLQSIRSDLLGEQVALQRHESVQRQVIARENFTKYWDTLKRAIRDEAPSLVDAELQWREIPLHPADTPSSRTWGIEVETVRAHLVNRPAGWDSRYDGSLPDEGGSSCNCDCDSCYDGDHCNDRGSDCYDDNDEDIESREFVSPVLESFNSRGLRSICDELPTREERTEPGIHVHVGARDLTIADVGRLLVAYSVAAPIIMPLYHREVYGYCKETGTSTIQSWLSAARRYLKEQGRLPQPVEIYSSLSSDRYQDVNVTALDRHGTIEFRAMGPYYDYDHLVRWAWFCREMVNVSKLGLPQQVWTRCKSVRDVVTVLRKYGSESPFDKDFLAIDTASLVLQDD